MLEREKFPRYHIGESLIPYTYFPLAAARPHRKDEGVALHAEVQRAVCQPRWARLPSLLLLQAPEARSRQHVAGAAQRVRSDAHGQRAREGRRGDRGSHRPRDHRGERLRHRRKSREQGRRAAGVPRADDPGRHRARRVFRDPQRVESARPLPQQDCDLDLLQGRHARSRRRRRRHHHRLRSRTRDGSGTSRWPATS